MDLHLLLLRDMMSRGGTLLSLQLLAVVIDKLFLNHLILHVLIIHSIACALDESGSDYRISTVILLILQAMVDGFELQTQLLHEPPIAILEEALEDMTKLLFHHLQVVDREQE